MYDIESGYYYLRSRYYDPSVGRFLNSDSIISGTSDSVNGYNSFAYCFNNPVNMSDFSGNWPVPKWVKKTVKNVAKVVKKAVDFVEKKISKLPVALTKKQNLNVQLGNVTAGAAIGVSAHANGDVLIAVTPTIGYSLPGGLGISSQTCSGIDIVTKTKFLKGTGTHISGTATMPIPNTNISGDGAVTFSQYYTGKGLKFYPGVSLDVGASIPQTEGFGIGASVGLDQTVEIASFNLYDEIDSAYIKIMEW